MFFLGLFSAQNVHDSEAKGRSIEALTVFLTCHLIR